jgi:hypothetical protein
MGLWQTSKNEPFDHRFGMGKIDEQANSVSSGLQVVERNSFRTIDQIASKSARLHPP